MTPIPTPHMLIITPVWDRNQRAYTLGRQSHVLVHNCDDANFTYAWPTTTTPLTPFTAEEIGQMLGGN